MQPHHHGWSRRELLGTLGTVAAAGVAWSHTAAGEQAQGAERGARPSPGHVRVAAVSYKPPVHDHRRQGVRLEGLREMTAKVARQRPDFVCYPEGCACTAGGFEKGMEVAPELEPFVEAVGRIARELQVALVVPFLERAGDRVYNSVPIVDRQGKLVLVYRKNYPTIHELELGITPGDGVPVAECDGVRVGATVCFDANFDHLGVELERQRARLVFWPSEYWGGSLLQHWALRYGFSIAVAWGAESAIIDMSGRYVARQGTPYTVRAGRMPAWAIADLDVNRELYHLDYNQDRLGAVLERYGGDVSVELFEPEGYFLLSSRRADVPVETMAAEFELETLRAYLARSVQMRHDRLPPRQP